MFALSQNGQTWMSQRPFEMFFSVATMLLSECEIYAMEMF